MIDIAKVKDILSHNIKHYDGTGPSNAMRAACAGIVELEAQITTLTSELAEWKSDSAKLEAEIATLLEEKSALRTQLAEVRAQRDALVKACKEIDTHIPDQPASAAGDELSWAQRHIAQLRMIARMAAAVQAAKAGEVA